MKQPCIGQPQLEITYVRTFGRDGSNQICFQTITCLEMYIRLKCYLSTLFLLKNSGDRELTSKKGNADNSIGYIWCGPICWRSLGIYTIFFITAYVKTFLTSMCARNISNGWSVRISKLRIYHMQNFFFAWKNPRISNFALFYLTRDTAINNIKHKTS